MIRAATVPSMKSKTMPRRRDDGDTAFVTDATAVLERMQDAFARVIEALGERSGSAIGKAAELQKQLKLDATLAWQAFRIAHGTDPLGAANYVPGPAAMGRFFDAARRRGVPVERVRNAEEAFAKFEQIVKRHAGDRGSFASMVTALADDGSDQVELKHKRAAFRANSFLWGADCKAHVMCNLLHPAQREDQVDIAEVQSVVGWRWFRPNATMPRVTLRARVLSPDRQGPPLLRIEPIEVSPVGPAGFSLLTNFCSQPPPEFTVSEDEPGQSQIRMVSRELGSTASVTYCVGEVFRDVPSPYTELEPTLRFSSLCGFPTQMLIRDVLIHEDLFGIMPPPSVKVYGNCTNNERALRCLDRERMPLRESATLLGRGANLVRAPEVPRYRELAEHVCKRLGWDPRKFLVYRCRVKYPVINTVTRLEFELPPQPPQQFQPRP